MTLEQYPWAGKVRMPAAWGALIDYAAPTWNHPERGPIPRAAPITSYDWFIIHYGGGNNPAGDLDPDDYQPPWFDKLKATIGIVRGVIQSWERYHIFSKKWRGMAYTAGVDQFGRLFGMRGTVQNGGQYGSEWNNYSMAVVSIMGGSQKPSRWMRKRIARMILEHPPKKGVLTHQMTGYPTSCAGPHWQPWVENRQWVAELGTQRVGKRNRTVLALRKRLHDLSYFDYEFGNQYTPAVARAVVNYQRDRGLKEDGIAGPTTFADLIDIETEGD